MNNKAISKFVVAFIMVRNFFKRVKDFWFMSVESIAIVYFEMSKFFEKE